MTKKEQQSAERENAIQRLRETLRPGDTVYTMGMQREISLFAQDGSDGIQDLTYWVARVLGHRIGKRGGVLIGGGGMDMGFALVYNLGRALWPNGYGCVGEKCRCRSSEHSNGDRNRTPHWHNDGGYALAQRWL